MFEAWSVAVKINVISNATQIFTGLSGLIHKAQRDTEGLNKTLALVGVGMAASGALGLKALGGMMKPAEEYTSQLLRMNSAGMKQAEVAESVGAAWKLAGQNMTTTATGNLKSLLDLRNVTGDMKEAIALLPMMQRMQTILAASSEHKLSSGSIELAYSAAKALDVRGAANDPANLAKQGDMMTRAIMATQGRVTPEMFKSVFMYARQAKFGLSDQFAYEILPSLMQESAGAGGGGGGSRGVGPMLAALYRFTNQGFVNRKSLPLLKELGWLGDGNPLSTTTTGTVVAPLKDADLAASNSFEWAKKRMAGIDAYLVAHKMESTDANVLSVINQATRGNQLAGSLLGEYYIKRKNFERDQHLIQSVMSPEDAYKQAITKDPATARRALSASWENFETSLMMNVVPIIVPALNQLAKSLNTLGAWSRAHPNMTKDLVLGFGALATAMAIGGTLTLLKVGFEGIAGVLGVAGGAGLIGTLGKAGLAGAAAFAIVEVGRLGLALNDLFGVKNRQGLALSVDANARLNDGHTAALLHQFDKDFKRQGPQTGGATDSWTAGTPGFASNGGGAAFGSPNIRGRFSGGAQAINNTIVMPDGRVLAKVVTDVQAVELSRPATGGRSFDGSMQPRGSW